MKRSNHYDAQSGRFAFDSEDSDRQNINIYTLDADGRNLRQLTDSPRFNFRPALSPDGKKIAFVSGRSNSGSDEIYLMNVDGTEQTRLTFDSHGCYSPAFSPDGSQIAFTTYGEGGFGVHIMNSDGTGIRQITQFAKGHDVPYCPVFTADGQSIIYDSRGPLYRVGTDGLNHRSLFAQQVAIYESVAVSPDGQKIAFVESHCHWNNERGDDYYYTYAVVMANLDGTNLTQMTDNFINAHNPTFNPSGDERH